MTAYAYDNDKHYMNPETGSIEQGSVWLHRFEAGVIQESEMDALIEVRKIGQYWVEI